MKKGKLILIIISIVIILVVFIIGRYYIGWKKINIENYEYNESTTVELDLDGDNIKENVLLEIDLDKGKVVNKTKVD